MVPLLNQILGRIFISNRQTEKINEYQTFFTTIGRTIFALFLREKTFFINFFTTDLINAETTFNSI